MRFRVDRYLSKQFDEKSYNCFDMAREVWYELTGIDLGSQTPKTKSEYEAKALKVANTLNGLEYPVSPCIILMLKDGSEPHVGIYYNGKILHIKATGSEYRPLCEVSKGYTSVRFYT